MENLGRSYVIPKHCQRFVVRCPIWIHWWTQERWRTQPKRCNYGWNWITLPGNSWMFVNITKKSCTTTNAIHFASAKSCSPAHTCKSVSGQPTSNNIGASTVQVKSTTRCCRINAASQIWHLFPERPLLEKVHTNSQKRQSSAAFQCQTWPQQGPGMEPSPNEYYVFARLGSTGHWDTQTVPRNLRITQRSACIKDKNWPGNWERVLSSTPDHFGDLSQNASRKSPKTVEGISFKT